MPATMTSGLIQSITDAGQNALAFGSGLIGSGQICTYHISSWGLGSGAIASGQIGRSHLASGIVATYANALFDDAWSTGETVSGIKAVIFTSGNAIALAMAGSGLRLPSVGVAITNALSGGAISLVYMGKVLVSSGLDATWSGQAGRSLFVGSGGMIVGSGLMASGQRWQHVGIAISGGLIVQPHPIVMSGLSPSLN